MHGRKKHSEPMIAAISCLLVCVAAASWAAPPAADKPRPNMVIFLSDDLGWHDCSIYGGRGIHMPNLQRLTADGMTFTHAFVASPSCAPSRGALLTGLSPPRNGAMFNHTTPDATFKRWPAYFQQLGYEVVAIGKVAHYASVQQYGFDFCSHFNFHQDDCIDAAVEWLEKRASRKPLCLFVGTNWPHQPWPQQTDYAPDAVPLPPSHVDTPETRQSRARYAAAVANADRDLGIIYAAARRCLGGDTFFLFSNDNGAQLPFAKWDCYDAGIRTPLIVVWPGKIAPGSRTDAMVGWVDMLPTCLEIAGGTPPPCGTGDGQISGRSFLAVLRGEKSEHRDLVFSTHSGDGSMNEYPIRSVRSREWQYVRNLAPDTEHHTHIDKARIVDGKDYWTSWERKAAEDPAAAAVVARYYRRPAEELYNLQTDPFELNNLAGQPAHAKTLAELRAALDAWMTAEGDKGLETERARKPQPAKKPGDAKKN